MPIKLLPWSIWKFCSASKRPYILLIGTGAQKIKWKSMVFYQTPLRPTPHQQCWQQWQVFFPAKKFSPYFSFRNMTTNEWNKFYSWIQLFDNGLLLPEILALWATFKAVLRAVDMLEFSRSFMVFDHQRPPPQYGKKLHSHLICLCTLPQCPARVGIESSRSESEKIISFTFSEKWKVK